MGRHRDAIFRFAYRHLFNEEDAEDVAQETVEMWVYRARRLLWERMSAGGFLPFD